MNIKWTKDLEVGDAKIDSQHYELIHKLNQFWNSVLVGIEPEKLFQAVDILSDSLTTHFIYEENLMIVHKFNKYSGYKLHLDDHRKFISQYNGIKGELIKDGTNIGLISKTLQCLDDWTNCHIKHFDMELIDFIKRLKIS